MSNQPARDGETLSDERAILSDDQVELIREEARSTATAEGFMLAHGSPTAHDILLLCDSHAALRAECARLRADNADIAADSLRFQNAYARTADDGALLDWMQERVSGTGETMQFGGSCYWAVEVYRGARGKPHRLGEGEDLRQALRAARAASGEDANHE